jgi:hypothetical protein
MSDPIILKNQFGGLILIQKGMKVLRNRDWDRLFEIGRHLPLTLVFGVVFEFDLLSKLDVWGPLVLVRLLLVSKVSKIVSYFLK